MDESQIARAALVVIAGVPTRPTLLKEAARKPRRYRVLARKIETRPDVGSAPQTVVSHHFEN